MPGRPADDAGEGSDRRFRDVRRPRLGRTPFPRNDHVRLQQRPLEGHAMGRQLRVDSESTSVVTSSHRSIVWSRPSAPPVPRWGRAPLPGTVRRIVPARGRWPGCSNASGSRPRCRSPRATSRSGAQRPIVRQALPQPVQPLGDLLPGKPDQRLRPFVDLDPRNDPLPFQHLVNGVPSAERCRIVSS